MKEALILTAIMIILISIPSYVIIVFMEWKHPWKCSKYRIIKESGEDKDIYVPQFSRNLFFFRIWGDWENLWNEERCEFTTIKEAEEYVNKLRYKSPNKKKPVRTIIWTDEK